MFLGILYDFIIWLAALAAIPRMWYQRLVYGKYRNSFSKRFGLGFPDIKQGKGQLVWIHAVSVGETKAVASLVKQFKVQFPDSLLVISSITETGHAEALRSMPFADYHVYLPLDLSWIINPIIRRTKPSLVIFSESDFWYHFIRSSKRVGAKILVVNGKISEKSTKRFLKIPFFSKSLFSGIDFFCVQNSIYLERFKKLGVPPEKMEVTGNMKFDEFYPKLSEKELAAWREQLGISSTDQILVAGSTHDPEEKLLISALQDVWQEHPQLKALIVPRHPERFQAVATLLAKQGIPFIRLSEINRRVGQEKVILIDAMGQLRKCYQLATVAFVGGSYTEKVGGHNIIEPCWYGVPVLFGPYMHSQSELLSLVQAYQAGLQIPSEQLSSTLLSLLNDPAKRLELGFGGERLVKEMRGATDKSFRVLVDLMKKTL